MTKPTSPIISFDQFEALQSPIELPAPNQFFDDQVSVLRAKGLEIPWQHVDDLRSNVPSTPQLFLVIPPRPVGLDLNRQIALIEIDGQVGIKSSLSDPGSLTDSVQMPQKTHLLLGVDDGEKRHDIAPSLSLQNIKQEKRWPLTLWQGIILAVLFPYVFNHFNGRYGFYLVGTRCGTDCFPGLYKNDKRAEFADLSDNRDHHGWGTPSAKSLISA